MSFNLTPNVRPVHPGGGHVPVGIGQRVSHGHNRQQQNKVVIVSPGHHGPNAVTVHLNGEHARQIPPLARNQMRSRVRCIPPQSPTSVHFLHQGELRQIPGTENGVVTNKNDY